MSSQMTPARELTTVREYTVGVEDRVFKARLADGPAGWWWQVRGCPNAIGPFATRKAAFAAYQSGLAAWAANESA